METNPSVVKKKMLVFVIILSIIKHLQNIFSLLKFDNFSVVFPMKINFDNSKTLASSLKIHDYNTTKFMKYQYRMNMMFNIESIF